MPRLSTTPKRTRTDGPRLSRDGIVASAIELADRDGIEALSMRRLAQQFGVDPMSLYNHVRDKSELLDEMADAVVAQIPPVTEEGDWASSLRALILSGAPDARRAPVGAAADRGQGRAHPGRSGPRRHGARHPAPRRVLTRPLAPRTPRARQPHPGLQPGPVRRFARDEPAPGRRRRKPRSGRRPTPGWPSLRWRRPTAVPWAGVTTTWSSSSRSTSSSTGSSGDGPPASARPRIRIRIR